MNGTADRSLLLVANDDELYGIDLEQVEGIRAYQPLTRLPHAPCLTGIINAGGLILPVIDLRQQLWGMPTNAGVWHIIVIVRHNDVSCGLLVDSVTEIIQITPDEIQPIAGQGKGGYFKELAIPRALTLTSATPVAILDLAAFAQLCREAPASEQDRLRENRHD